MMDATAPACVFSIDVEDWFHILDLPSAPRPNEWDRMPSRVEANFRQLLLLLHEHGVSATCFFLGWVARRHPDLVREARQLGHEIASHGFLHELVFQMGKPRFRQDIADAKHLLEDMTGEAVLGYRAPGFSVTERTPWFFECVSEAGYRYDSSVFPAMRRHGGLIGAPATPYRINDIVEFPISVRRVLGRPVCFFGGGYLRLSPLWLIKSMARDVLRSGRPVNFYVHPREIDPDQPRLAMTPLRRFQTYINLHSTRTKLIAIAREFDFVTFRHMYENSRADINVRCYAASASIA
jgi:polysaccharide deacetylase family protein (PEP-CTERM system associated)